MFKNVGNIGGKIKKFAEVIGWIGIVASIIRGVWVMLADTNIETIFFGLVICVFGSLLSWFVAFFLYGFGQQLENTDILVRTLAPEYANEYDAGASHVSDKVMENIRQEYAGPDWEDDIKALSNATLQERLGSDDWQAEYKALCQKELDRRMRG